MKTVIVRPEVFKSFIWEGNNLEEFHDNFERYDFSVREDGRLLATKVGTLSTCYLCENSDHEIICSKDVVLKSVTSGEIKKIPIEIFIRDYVEIQPPDAKETETLNTD